MNRIDDTTLSIVLKLAAKASTDEDVEMYKNLDVSDCEISERVRRKFQRNLAWEFGRSTRQNILRVAKTVVVACLALCTLVFGTAMCIEPVRTAFVEAVITWYEDYIGFRLMREENMEYPTTIEKVYLPGNLSDEWVVTKEYEYPEVVVHSIKGQNDEYMQLKQTLITDQGIQIVDNTEVQMETVQLNSDVQGYVTIYSPDKCEIIWYTDYRFEIYAENIPLEFVVNTVNSVK